jgi:hypothetical protein
VRLVFWHKIWAGFGRRKAPSGIFKVSTLGVLQLRAIKPAVYDRSAKRFAQDDGFVRGLEIQLVVYAENT